ncbi:MAG: hypothetical protein K5884_05865 [Ruminococcus sp.]|nr:hypothetical protein [Ruminococcus sp.]
MGEGVNLVSTALSDVTTVFTAATNMITGNAIAMVFIGFSLASAGVGLFRKIIRKH